MLVLLCLWELLWFYRVPFVLLFTSFLDTTLIQGIKHKSFYVSYIGVIVLSVSYYTVKSCFWLMSVMRAGHDWQHTLKHSAGQLLCTNNPLCVNSDLSARPGAKAFYNQEHYEFLSVSLSGDWSSLKLGDWGHSDSPFSKLRGHEESARSSRTIAPNTWLVQSTLVTSVLHKFLSFWTYLSIPPCMFH